MSPSTARTHTRPTRRTRPRVENTASAARALEGLDHDHGVYVLTFGEFSLSDVLAALLDRTGPAQVTACTWTAAAADLEQQMRWLEDGRIRSLRFLVDQSFRARQPAYAARLVELFGPGAVRTTRTHAKFATVRGGGWDFAVRTSMNRNSNPRLESLEVDHDPDLCGFLDGIVDEIWAGEPPGIQQNKPPPHYLAHQNHGIPGLGPVTGIGAIGPLL